MPNPNDDVLYMYRFSLSGGEAPGEHIGACRSGPNRALVSQHLRQVVEAHNSMPENVDNEMKVISLTPVTEAELDAAVSELRMSNPTRVDAADVYPDEKDRIRLIAVQKQSA